MRAADKNLGVRSSNLFGLRTPRVPMLAREDRLFEHLLSALDAYLAVINFDDIDKRSKVGLSERRRAPGEVLSDGTPETFDQSRINLNLGSRLLPGTFQCGL